VVLAVLVQQLEGVRPGALVLCKCLVHGLMPVVRRRALEVWNRSMYKLESTPVVSSGEGNRTDCVVLDWDVRVGEGW
jgi:hypothetical protein